MSRSPIWLALSLLMAVSGPALAQDPTTDEARTAVEPTVRGVLEAILLPGLAQEARRVGLPEADIAAVFDVSRERNLPPEERREIFQNTTEIVRDEGPIDNFGAFVRSRLDQGLRGRALADAIRAEHQLRGKGRGHRGEGKSSEMQGGKPEDRGRPDDAGAQGRGGEDRRDQQRNQNDAKGGQ